MLTKQELEARVQELAARFSGLSFDQLQDTVPVLPEVPC